MLRYFKDTIQSLRDENRYREFLDISRICGQFPRAINNKNGQKITVWCSNDYLGMGQNTDAIDAGIKVLKEYGTGSGGTRNISGTSHILCRLEELVAKLHNKETALTFTSGYVANDAAIQTLAKILPDLVIFSDQKNHASIISGIRNSKAQKEIFRHNDMVHLEELLKKYPQEQPKLIVFESVYSMDGDFGEVVNIINLAKQYGALTFIDEVHAVGIYGDTGAGICEELGVADKIDIIQATFAKSYGAIGGYITAKSEIIDAIRLVASGFIFTTSLTPSTAASIMVNINHLRENSFERDSMRAKVKILKAKLQDAQINMVENQSHIVSVRVGDAKKVQEISKRLLEEFNIYVQHINYPTVDKGDERLRITISPLHSDKMIDELVDALKVVS